MSDNTGSSPDKPDKPVKVKPDWPLIRSQYENGDISHRNLAKLFRVAYGTLSKRSMREKWKQRKALARNGTNLIQDALSNEMESAIVAVAKTEAARFRDEIQPWIEKRKSQIIKRGYKLYNRGVSRIEKVWDSNPSPTDAKKESEAARAIETLVRVGRTSLGMGDSQPGTGAFSLSILAGNAAVQVNTPVPAPNDPA